jgi:hypothetical protein
MAGISIPQLPNYTIPQQPPPDLLGMAVKMGTLRQMNQLLPLDIQEKQQQVQAQTQENQLRQIQLQDQNGLHQAMIDSGGDPDKLRAAMGDPKYGISPNGQFSTVKMLNEYKQNQMALDEATRKNNIDSDSSVADRYQKISQLPPDQQPSAVNDLKADTDFLKSLTSRGRQEISNYQYQGPDSVKLMAHSHMTRQALDEQADKEASAAKAQAQAGQANVETALKQVTLDRIKSSQPGTFDSQIDQLAPLLGPDGKPGPLASFNNPLKVAVNGALARGDYETATKILTDGFNQIGDISKETNPAVIAARGQIAAATAQASENARLQFGNDKDARDRIDSTVLKPYQEKMSEIGELQSAIGQAQAGNIAAARATLYKVIGVAQPQGTHRVAPTEVSGFSGMGSIPERIRGSIANALSGDPWTPQMVQDIKDFGAAQAQVAQDNLSRGIDATNTLYKTKVGEGLKTGPGSANAGALANLPALAKGFTRIQASDGSIHDIPSGKLDLARKRDPGLKALVQ